MLNNTAILATMAMPAPQTDTCLVAVACASVALAPNCDDGNVCTDDSMRFGYWLCECGATRRACDDGDACTTDGHL